ncbi:MAG: PAS domain S-box protein [Chloroflexota bacterium]|nr:PAS domain S-box protein [Chloroflexota bacterium]
MVENKIQFQKLIEKMNQGLGVVDKNSVLIYVNPRLAEMVGYTQGEMVGNHLHHFFSQNNYDIVVEQLAHQRMGHEKPYTINWLCKDGSELHTQIVPTVDLDEKGELLHSIAVVSDITEQDKVNRLFEKRLEERIQEISSLMEVSRIIISPFEFKDQLKHILEKLVSLIKCNGSSILLRKENLLISETFRLDIKDEIVEWMVRPFEQPDMLSSRFWYEGALVFPNINEQGQAEHNFKQLIKSMMGTIPPDLVSWIGIPIKSRKALIGVLTAHAAQSDFFTPEMAELMQPFANQLAIIFENNRLYSQARLAAAASERDRLARELHDSVTQSLYSIRLYADASRYALKAGKLPAAEKNLEQLSSIARDGMSELRLLIFELRPPALEKLGLLGALQERLNMVESRSGIHADLNVEGEPDLSQDLETQLYWIVYEALSNVLKHAKAKHVSLKFHFTRRSAVVTLKDDGVGFDPTTFEDSHGGGLKNIVERVNGFGGKISVQSEPGEGTKLRVEYKH